MALAAAVGANNVGASPPPLCLRLATGQVAGAARQQGPLRRQARKLVARIDELTGKLEQSRAQVRQLNEDDADGQYARNRSNVRFLS